jgi:N4-(beta-N-acetylglucosaminyl)-L-asparaginase
MARKVTRREFVQTGAVLLSSTIPTRAPVQAPTILVPSGIKSIVISSANGNIYKNGGTQTCVEKAFAMMTGGADVLDALIAGVNILELDPAETSVGYGALPNADRTVQLDASVMHGPRRRAGAVAALEGVRTPSSVARLVADLTDHHLLVGKGAKDFARMMGFTIEADLITETSSAQWLEWKRRTDPVRYLDPQKRGQAWYDAGLQMARERVIDLEHCWGTVNCNGINSKGEICGVTTSSGLAWNIPGRVGDSAIFGAGVYVDGMVGAAGSTGRGEANYHLCSFLIVEEMHRGVHPKDAAIAAVKRVARNTTARRLLNSKGRPNFGLNFYALNAKGEFGCAALYQSSYAVCTDIGPETRSAETLFDGHPTD